MGEERRIVEEVVGLRRRMPCRFAAQAQYFGRYVEVEGVIGAEERKPLEPVTELVVDVVAEQGIEGMGVR